MKFTEKLDNLEAVHKESIQSLENSYKERRQNLLEDIFKTVKEFAQTHKISQWLGQRDSTVYNGPYSIRFGKYVSSPQESGRYIVSTVNEWKKSRQNTIKTQLGICFETDDNSVVNIVQSEILRDGIPDFSGLDCFIKKLGLESHLGAPLIFTYDFETQEGPCEYNRCTRDHNVYKICGKFIQSWSTEIGQLVVDLHTEK